MNVLPLTAISVLLMSSFHLSDQDSFGVQSEKATPSSILDRVRTSPKAPVKPPLLYVKISTQRTNSDSSAGFDVVSLFKNHPAREYVLTRGDASRMSLAGTSLSKAERRTVLLKMIQGPDFGGQYRLVQLDDGSGEKVKVYITDLRNRRGRFSDQIGEKIGSNFFYNKRSFGLLEAYNEYPSGRCKIIGWLFNEGQGEFVQKGVKDWPSGGNSCDLNKNFRF